MAYYVELLALIGGFYLLGKLWGVVKTVWATRDVLFNTILDRVDILPGNNGATDSLRRFCAPMLPQLKEDKLEPNKKKERANTKKASYEGD